MRTNNHMTAITPELVKEHGLTEGEYAHIKRLLNREPSFVELGIFSVMWSEHCSYKSTRIHLRKLPTKAPWVLQGPGENAGVIDIGDGDACIFKMESHNHPSFIEPYQGAATGVGGIMRDVFTMGARPIALFDERAAFRRAGPSQDAPSGRRRGAWHRRLRQLHGRAHRRRRSEFPSLLQRQHPRQRDVRGHRQGEQHFPLRRQGRGQSRRLYRLQDGPRRHPRRDDGVRRIRRCLG